MPAEAPPCRKTDRSSLLKNRTERRRRVAILGGSFDPPHAGHIEIARRAREALGADEAILVVAGYPYQKNAWASAEQRYEMTKLAAADEEGLSVSRVEVDRPGPSYTVDTVEELLAADPDTEIWLVVGADAAKGITTWHRWQDLVRKAKFCVVPRPGWPVEEAKSALSQAGADFVVMELPSGIPYSSTAIRKAIASGEEPDGLSPAVAKYVVSHGLYR